MSSRLFKAYIILLLPFAADYPLGVGVILLFGFLFRGKSSDTIVIVSVVHLVLYCVLLHSGSSGLRLLRFWRRRPSSFVSLMFFYLDMRTGAMHGMKICLECDQMQAMRQ
jgi:hypothetical protein